MKHFVIPDVQARPGHCFKHLSYIGKYIVEKRPDVIVCLGDFADCESLCSYDKGKKSFEGRRYKADMLAAKQAMDALLEPMRTYNQRMKDSRHAQYKPRMVLTLGNHEARIARVSEFSPELDGVISYDDLPYQEWEVIDFLKPININGIMYVHYLAAPFTGKPYGGNALNQLKTVGKSFVVGHKQTLDVTTRYLLDGTQQWGIIAGACYPHFEGYKGYQGNDHFRGALMLHRVVNGSFDPCVISLDYFKDKYGEK